MAASSTWAEFLQHAKFWRNETKRSFGETLSELDIAQSFQGIPTLFALASMPDDSSSQQNILYASLTTHPSPAQTPASLELKPLLNQSDLGGDSDSKPSPELCLFYERLRRQIYSGISGFSYHKSGSLLVSTTSNLFTYKDKKISPIATYVEGPALTATFSPIDSNYVAFCVKGQIFIDRQNVKLFESPSLPNITNGVASFIAQEEFERFEGFWWNPKKLEILYERVDESSVAQLNFTLPGSIVNFGNQQINESQFMRYPLAGTSNPLTTLRICQINEQSGSVVDLESKVELKNILPWSEYMVRCGWSTDGQSVYVLAMDRVQSRMALLLLPRGVFAEESVFVPNAEQQVRILYEEQGRYWINANNLTYFLPNQQDGQLRVIIGSEKLDQCHLYLHTFDLTGAETSRSEMPITQGQDWSVLKEASLRVDHSRQLVYFLANKISPLILSVCVAAYGCSSNQECCVLTPEDLSYKFERSQPMLNLNPDVGFVCWLSNSLQLPECRFYSLQYPSNAVNSSKHISAFPTPVFAYRICIQAQVNLHSSTNMVKSTSPSSDFSSSANLNAAIAKLPNSGQPSLYKSCSSIFHRKYFKYLSSISNTVHYAVLLWPADPKWSVEGKKFPVIQHVYAGPSIQNVKDSWFSVAQHMKFVTQGYAVLIVDGRGSANRGTEFEGGIRHNLGSIEVDDQVEGLQVVAQQSQLLDLNRVVVFGWSYGGYMSLLLLASHPQFYRAACAGGAVTDWTLYDTCYTERYMGLPMNEGEELYKRSSVLGRLDSLPDEAGRLLIVHGMVDENVHFRHTEKLINGLIGAGKPHQLLLFPNERHAVRNGAAIEYFHATMLYFFGKALA